MLKYSVAIAALLLGAPVAFAQGAGDKTGGGAGMSSSGPSSSGPNSSGSSSSGLKSGGGSAERSGASSGASEGASGSDRPPPIWHQAIRKKAARLRKMPLAR